MAEKTARLGESGEVFQLSQREGSSLRELAEEADFDEVHFFLKEALVGDEISAPVEGEETTYVLLPYEHGEDAIDEETFRLLEESGYEAATLRDLLLVAIEKPELQHKFEVLGLGTMRTRKVYGDKPGETVWTQKERDKTICQWVVGLSSWKGKRTLVPMELYLTKLLRRSALLLVKRVG